jgi:hypothetical protein
MTITGTNTARLLRKYECGDYLSDCELDGLIDGLEFVVKFLLQDNMRRLMQAYSRTLSQLIAMRESRKEK